MSRRKEICREIIDHMHPDVVKRADRLLAKLLIKCPQAKADGADKVKFSADPDVLRVLATYASFGHRSFIESMRSVLEERALHVGDVGEPDDAFSIENQNLIQEDSDPDMVEALDDAESDLFK